MSNPDDTEEVNEVPAVKTRKQTVKGLTYSAKILFDRRKILLLSLQKKSENIKNLMENKFNVRKISEELKQYDDFLKLMIFGLMKLIKKYSPSSILCIIIYKKMKTSC